jgi:nifR3 family TIM-barrel protein
MHPDVTGLRIGQYELNPPVVLAPMAGITNVAFRGLCREFGSPRALYVCEMITTRALVEHDPRTMRMISFAAGERPRSMQLYGVDPQTTARAVRMVAEENLADHLDLNYGCPMPKITRNGGGAAIPYKRRLFASIMRAAVGEARQADIPVTAKFRVGIDADHHTYLDAGRIAEDEGAAAVALHSRTAAQRYSGVADWSAISRLKEAVTSIPVLGNGDIFAATDALKMLERTGADGVVVGRGCLGRPWLFGELVAALSGHPVPDGPTLGRVSEVLRRHAELLIAHYRTTGDAQAEFKGCRELRKHSSWYLHGFPVGSALRRRFGLLSSLAELDELLGQLDPDVPFPPEAEGPRGRQGSPAKVALPEGWLDDPQDGRRPATEDMHSGG